MSQEVAVQRFLAQKLLHHLKKVGIHLTSTAMRADTGDEALQGESDMKARQKKSMASFFLVRTQEIIPFPK